MSAGNIHLHGAQKLESQAGRMATEAMDKAQQLMDKARDTTANVGEKAREAASNLGDKARDSAAALKERADDTLSTVGQKMTSLGENLREKAPREGMLGSAASTMADNLRSSGRYLQEHNLDGMGRDVENLIRQYPIRALLIGVGVGCLLGMALRGR
jgi:ElaB/YqjD/DUF883 family membrane-anchored ribosome-binding protein